MNAVENISFRIMKAEICRKKSLTHIYITFIFMIPFILLMSSMITAAGNRQQTSELYKYYTSIEVKQGDTLWSIASEYYEENGYSDIRGYVNELRQLNYLKDDRIQAGENLIVTYYSDIYK